MLLTTIFLGAALMADDACALPTGSDARPCSARVGHCLEVEIAGQRAVPLADAALRAQLSEAVGADVCWAIPEAVAGAIQPKAVANAYTEQLGELREGLEVVVTGLEGQKVETHKGIRTDPTVRIGGIPMQTAVDVIDADSLPPGKYVVKVRIVGRKGYDNKRIYLRVAQPAAANPH